MHPQAHLSPIPSNFFARFLCAATAACLAAAVIAAQTSGGEQCDGLPLRENCPSDPSLLLQVTAIPCHHAFCQNSCAVACNAAHQYFTLDTHGNIILPSRVTDVVIDVGQADTPILPASASQMVIGFEPIDEWHRANTETWGELETFMSIPAGAGACDERLPFKRLRYGESSSFLSLDQGEVAGALQQLRDAGLKNAIGVSFSEKDFDLVGETIVPVVQLRHMLERLPPQLEVSMLKIDAQGYELRVLMGAGNMSRVTKVVSCCLDLFGLLLNLLGRS